MGWGTGERDGRNTERKGRRGEAGETEMGDRRAGRRAGGREVEGRRRGGQAQPERVEGKKGRKEQGEADDVGNNPEARGRDGKAGRRSRKTEREPGSEKERALENREGEGTHTRPPNIKYLTGDDKSNGNYCGKNIIRNLIEVKQNLHNTAN